MEVSGYRGGEGRTRYRQLNWRLARYSLLWYYLWVLALYFGYFVRKKEENYETLKCTIAYDGSRFCGYQIQPEKRTVQSELERCFSEHA